MKGYGITIQDCYSSCLTSLRLLRNSADFNPGVLDNDPYSDVPPLPVLLPVFISLKCFMIDFDILI